MTRQYVQRMPSDWYLRKPGYRIFMIRELTSFFVGAYVIVLLIWLQRLSEGPAAFAAFTESLRTPLWVALHVLALLAALIHSITWFNLTPAVMPVRFGETPAPGALVAAATGYIPWLVISAVILWAVLA